MMYPQRKDNPYELFSDDPKLKIATKELRAAVKIAKQAIKANHVKNLKQAIKGISKIQKRYMNAGAYDTEPCCIIADELQSCAEHDDCWLILL